MPTLTALEEKLAKLNTAPPDPAPEPPKAAKKAAASNGNRQQSEREGKVHIGAWLHKDFKRSLLLVRAATGDDVQTIIARALNAEFRAHKVPIVNN
jgi:hypothetical protein